MAETTTERALVAGGVVAVGLGLVVMVVPGVAGLVGASDAFVVILGLVALVQAARTASDVWSAPRENAVLPDAHRSEPATVAGELFDRTFELSGRRGEVGRRNRARVERYLRDAGVALLSAETGEASEVVRGRLDAGTWTDDSVAAALFAEEYEPTWRDELRAIAGRETTFQRRVRRAVGAIEANTDGPVGRPSPAHAEATTDE